MANVESTGLNNALKLINRETERVSENPNARRRFETCKQLRRQTFRYCSYVEDESYLATLLNANDQLSDVLILYEQLDKSFDYDSDSEDYEDPDVLNKGKSPISPQRFAGLSLNDAKGPPMPARPNFHVTMPSGDKGKGVQEPEEEEPDDEEDENDPFADRNAVSTPKLEKGAMTW